MTSKIMTNSDGETCIKLPISGTVLKFRQPKGKDLVKFEQLAASDNPDYLTNSGAMAAMASHLCTNPDVSFDTMLDLDAVDFLAVGEVVNSFSFLSKLHKV